MTSDTLGYSGLDSVAQSCINHSINEGWPGNREKLGNRGSYILPLFFLFEMASSENFNNVLKQLTAISRRLKSGEDALSELHVLKEHGDCDRVLAEACVGQQRQQSESAKFEFSKR